MPGRKRPLSVWGKQCKMQMVALDMTLEDISRETHISRNNISRIINGGDTSDDSVIAISKALQVDPDLPRWRPQPDMLTG